MNDKKTKASALREELRIGRNGTPHSDGETASGTSPLVSGIQSNDDPEVRTVVQDAGRKISTFTPTGGKPPIGNRRNRDDRRSLEGEPGRSGRGNRRSEESHGGVVADPTNPETATRSATSTVAHAIGRLATDVLIDTPGVFRADEPEQDFTRTVVELSPFKEDYRRTQRLTDQGKRDVYALIADANQFISPDAYRQLVSKSSVNADAKAAKPQLFQGTVLSKKEAEEMYEPLVAALADDFGYVDKALWKLCPQLDKRPIWSNTTNLEDQAIAKALLSRGQKSAATAAVVRGVVDSADYIMVGMALGPRIGETVKAIRERPRAARSNLSLFRKA